MKTTIFLICLIIAGCALPYESAHGSEISKADIIATVEHLRSLTHEAQAETAAAKAETATIQQAADKLQHERDYWKDDDAKAWAYGKEEHAWGQKNEQAVKSLASLVAALIAFFWLGPIVAGQILKNLPAVEGWIATVAAVGAIFLGIYYGTISVIYVLSPWIPTIPVWHDIGGMFHHIPKIP
jgi:hypothetical protein